MASPMIDLTTPRDRLSIKMNAGTFTFRSPYDLSLPETRRFDALLPKFLHLSMKSDKRTPKDDTELMRISKEVCETFLLDGDASQVGPTGHLVLADLFFDLCLQTTEHLAQVRAALSQAGQSDGAKLFPDSRGSSAVPLGNGSRKPRSARSKPS